MESAGDPGHNRGQAVGGGRRGRRGGQRNVRRQAPLLSGGRGLRLRGVGERGRAQGHEPRQRQQQQRVSNEIRAIVVDPVVNHAMTMTEAATMIQPNLRRSIVASIIRTFRNENRIETRPNRGGRGKILTDQQERAVVNLVRVKNDIRLTEIRQHILDNDDMFNNVEAISLPTIAHMLKRHQVSLKQLYRVPFERNADRVKQLRTEYVQRVMKLDADENHHKFLFLDEAGFNLAKTRRRGRNFIGQRATIQVPAQRGTNIPMCAAISEEGVVGRRPRIGSFNAALLVTFLDELNQVCRADGVTYVIVWDNVRFHHAEMMQAWFQTHLQFTNLYLPPYSPLLNPTEEFFSTWRWKVYDRRPHEQATLLQAMDDACNDIMADQCQAWIRHARRFFPRCLANENIHCDVDENLWPNPQDRVDGNIEVQ